MIAIESGGKAQYDDQLGVFAAYTRDGDVRAKTLDDLAARVPLTDQERADLQAEKDLADVPDIDPGELARLAAEREELETQVATLRTLKAEMQGEITAAIIAAIRAGFGGP